MECVTEASSPRLRNRARKSRRRHFEIFTTLRNKDVDQCARKDQQEQPERGREGDEVRPDADVEIMLGKHNNAQRADQPKSANPRKCHKKRDAHDDTDDRR